MQTEGTKRMLTKTALKQRGWSESLIEKFAATPDEIRDNPRYRSAAPMRLFCEDRIQRIEATAAFKVAKEGAKKFQARAQRAVKTKRAKMEAYLAALKIEIPTLPDEVLVEQARKSYYSLGHGHDSTPADERLCVNYLRHEQSHYEEELSRISGRVDARDAYFEIKDKVLTEIALTYPWLADECFEQQSRMWEQREREDRFGVW